MKKLVTFVAIIAFLGTVLPLTSYAWKKHHRYYRHHHRYHPPTVVIAPKPTPRPKGWCAKYPKKCHRTVNTKREACWDVNRDGYIDDREAAGMKSHPGKCPSK